jgi:hypothetical protein
LKKAGEQIEGAERGRGLRRKSDEIATLLGSLAMESDGKPADAALAKDWSAAMRRVISRRDGHTKDAA